MEASADRFIREQLRATNGGTLDGFEVVHLWLPEGKWDHGAAPIEDTAYPSDIQLNEETRDLLTREGYVEVLAWKIHWDHERAITELEALLDAFAMAEGIGAWCVGPWTYVYAEC